MGNNQALNPLSGTAPEGKWLIGNADRVPSDARQAIFPIVLFDGPNTFNLVGTGFYVLPNGLFATAAHVARALTDEDGQILSSAFIIFILPDNQFMFRPIGRLFFHTVADAALGLAAEIRLSDALLTEKVLHLSGDLPEKGTPISAWGYPSNKTIKHRDGTFDFIVQPNFYDGILSEYYKDRGPSGRLSPPYCLTTMHIHGGASGAPIFEPNGKVVAVASSSYDGMVDCSFITPISEFLDIRLNVVDLESSENSFPRLAEILKKIRIVDTSIERKEMT